MSSIILAIETSGTICSVALSYNNTIVENRNEGINSHSSTLHVLIDQLIKKENIPYSALEAIVLSKGPGSYTGLRIGSSTVKGLCVALNKPMIAIASHESMLYDETINLSLYDVIFCATDARRDEVYLTIFNNKRITLAPTQSVVLEGTNPTDAYIDKKILIIGSGAHKFEKYRNNFMEILDSDCLSAENLVQPAISAFAKKRFEDIHHFEPYYLKQFYTTQKPLSF